MSAKIIDGKAVALEVRKQWKQRVMELKGRGILPGLAVIIVGNNPASQVYVRNKIKACHEVKQSKREKHRGGTQLVDENHADHDRKKRAKIPEGTGQFHSVEAEVTCQGLTFRRSRVRISRRRVFKSGVLSSWVMSRPATAT